MTEPGELVSTAEAADLLGVKTSTVYTYVSRGHLDPIRKQGDTGSWFDRSAIERLARSDRRRRRPAQSSRPPRVDTTHTSAITEIDGHSYRYRGMDPAELAAGRTFEAVTELLWTGSLPDATDWPQPTVSRRAAGNPPLPLDQLRVALADLAVGDQLRFGKTPAAIQVTGRTLLVELMGALSLVGDGADSDAGFAGHLWARLAADRPEAADCRALDSALIIVADHGVAPSTLAVRVAAAYRADLYGAVQSGLSIMAGGWYGRRAISAEQMLDRIEEVGDAEQVVGDLFRQGGVPCLGQPRYRGPDPRTELMLGLIEQRRPQAPALAAVREVQRITADRQLPAPSVELGLAALGRSFGFVPGASEAIFALGRSAGWIAHAIEMYGRPIAAPPDFRHDTAGGA